MKILTINCAKLISCFILSLTAFSATAFSGSCRNGELEFVQLNNKWDLRSYAMVQVKDDVTFAFADDFERHGNPKSIIYSRPDLSGVVDLEIEIAYVLGNFNIYVTDKKSKQKSHFVGGTLIRGCNELKVESDDIGLVPRD